MKRMHRSSRKRNLRLSGFSRYKMRNMTDTLSNLTFMGSVLGLQLWLSTTWMM